MIGDILILLGIILIYYSIKGYVKDKLGLK
jgi:hypothetical protein